MFCNHTWYPLWYTLKMMCNYWPSCRKQIHAKSQIFSELTLIIVISYMEIGRVRYFTDWGEWGVVEYFIFTQGSVQRVEQYHPYTTRTICLSGSGAWLSTYWIACLCTQTSMKENKFVTTWMLVEFHFWLCLDSSPIANSSDMSICMECDIYNYNLNDEL